MIAVAKIDCGCNDDDEDHHEYDDDDNDYYNDDDHHDYNDDDDEDDHHLIVVAKVGCEDKPGEENRRPRKNCPGGSMRHLMFIMVLIMITMITMVTIILITKTSSDWLDGIGNLQVGARVYRAPYSVYK